MSATAAGARPPLLRLAGIEKGFPGVRAIRSADLEVLPGEIHALIGENGAGKSTLIKIVTGAHGADAGTVEMSGARVRFAGPIDASRAGIAAIYQEFNLVPGLRVRENVFLGRERSRAGLVDERFERRRTREIMARLGVEIDPEAPTRELDVARQQLVEIARALSADARLLVMDEPTAALTDREVDNLFRILGELRASGHGVLFITHRLAEVARIADRVTVMRDGVTLGTWPAAELPPDRLIELMVGRPMEEGFPPPRASFGDEILVLQGVSGGAVKNVSLAIRRGEILGLAGLVGSGRTELARMIFGAAPRDAGRILVEGRAADFRSPRDAILRGVGLLTEDRKGQGLALGLSAIENFSLPNLPHWSRGGWIRGGSERRAFRRYVEDLNIRVAAPEQPAKHLSGGNQQKLLVARWLESDSRVLLFDEPTRGIDVGARYEMYNLMRDLVARGKGILMISSDLPEILGMSDRILVMHDGRIRGEIRDVAAATQEQVMRLAVA